MSATATRGHREAGFAVVELMVAMIVALAVLLATFQSLDLFRSNAAHQTRVTDANDQVRSTMDRVVRDLRGASAIVRANVDDLVYAVPVTVTAVPLTTGFRTERICIASGDLYGSSVVATAPPTAPAAACSTATKLVGLPSTATTAFSYDGATTSATPALVKNVGLTFSLDASGGGMTSTSTLRASAARRSAGTLPITEDDLGSKCNSSGALLSLSAGIPGLAPLTVTYADTGGISLGTPTGNTLQIPEGITNVVATVTDAAGATNIIQRRIECGTA